MPAVRGAHFTSQSMADCAFCPTSEGGRGFRTSRQCAGCNRPLCLVCRPQIAHVPYLCPDCGGGPLDNALRDPGACIERLKAAGHTVPYWLSVIHERLAAMPVPEAEELIVPE
jgi:hypothetical protein